MCIVRNHPFALVTDHNFLDLNRGVMEGEKQSLLLNGVDGDIMLLKLIMSINVV